MNKPAWRDRKAHRAAKCWDKPVHERANRSHVRICPHGVAYSIVDDYDMFTLGRHQLVNRRWKAIDEFFIRSGTYDW